MHHFLETLSEFLSNWPVISGERTERKPVKDRKKILSLHYRPICKITDDKTRDNDIPKKD